MGVGAALAMMALDTIHHIRNKKIAIDNECFKQDRITAFEMADY